MNAAENASEADEHPSAPEKPVSDPTAARGHDAGDATSISRPAQAETHTPRRRRRTRRTAIIVMGLTGLGMVSALALDLLVARRLGATAVYDALVVGLILPRLLQNVGREAMKFSLVSALIRAGAEDREDQSDSAAGSDSNNATPRDRATRAVTAITLLAAAATALLVLLAEPLVRLVGPGLENAAEAATYLRLLAAMAFAAVVSAALEVVLNASERFTLPALRNLLPSAITLAVIFYFEPPHETFTARPIALAYSIGFLAYLLLLYAAALQARVIRPAAMPDRATWQLLRRAAGLPLAGFSVRQAARAGALAVASLAPPGHLGALNIAYRLLAALQGVVGVSLATVGQPRLTRQSAAGENQAFRRTLLRRIKLVALIGVPAAVAIGTLARPLLTLLLPPDRFTAEGLTTAVVCLQILAPALPFYFLTPVLNASLYAQGRLKVVFLNMCLAAAVNLSVALTLFPSMGVRGVAWSATISAVISVGVLLVVVLKGEGRDLEEGTAGTESQKGNPLPIAGEVGGATPNEPKGSD